MKRIFFKLIDVERTYLHIYIKIILNYLLFIDD